MVFTLYSDHGSKTCFYRTSFQFDSYILVDLNPLRHKLSQKFRPTPQSTSPSQSLSEGITEGQ